MATLNKTMLLGKLTRDPSLSYTPNGTAVCEFSLAVNRKYKSGDEWKEEVCFVDITVWARSAENCAEYLKKGFEVFVEGRLVMDEWEQDGKKRSKLKVVAENVQFLTFKGTSECDEPQRQYNAPQNNNDPVFNDNPPF